MENMEQFFTQVGQVRILLDALSRHVEDVQRRHAAILSNPNQEEEGKAELERLDQEARSTSDLIRQRLKRLQAQDPADGSALSRIHRNQLSHLTLCFADVTRRHHAAQTAFREDRRARIRRQLHVVSKETTDEELEQMLDRGRLAVFASHTNPSFCAEALGQIQARQRDLARLEASISHLQQLFADVAALLDSQGELMDNIEKNVTSAAEFIGQSSAETQKAVGYKKNPSMVASLPGFLKPSARKTNLQARQTRSEPDQT